MFRSRVGLSISSVSRIDGVRINSLAVTTEIDPKSDMALKTFVLQFTHVGHSDSPKLPNNPDLR